MSDEENGGLAESITTLYRAKTIASGYGHEYVTLEHLLAALIEQQEVATLISTLNVDPLELATEVADYLTSEAFPITGTQPRPTETLNELVMRAVGITAMSGRGKITPTDLLLHLTQMPHDDSFAVTMLLKVGITPLALKRILSHGKPKQPRMEIGPDGMPQQQQAGADFNTPEEAEAFLEKYAMNLNKQAANSKIDPLIGRELEVATLIQIAARRTKNNGVLVGEPGVGKTAIAEGLALKIVRKEVPEVLLDSTIYSLDIGALVAGTRFRGDFEERMKQVIKAVEMIPGAMLFIDEIHTVLGAGAGSQGSLDVANLLKPALAKGTLRVIGSTTLEEYRKHFEKDRALLRRFKKVDVDEPSVADSKLILRGLKENYEVFHGVKFTEEALDAAVELTHRYLTSAFLPDKAIDVIDNAGARQRVSPADQRKAVIGIAEIEIEVAKVAKIPEQNVAEDEKDKLTRLEDDLKANVIGQDSALIELSDAVILNRAGLNEPNKPAGAYLFTGPTGVGKTEAARTLADTLNIPLLKYDMSEYMEKHSVAKLIGAPPGYVGYGEGNNGAGKLTNDIDTHPHCVLLLDEIEKAHPDVFNILLQVMDDGALTSSSGKRVDFRNVILIMTSNVGAAALAANKIGFGSQKDVDADDPEIKRMFSPEFRNRLDAIVKFGRLKPEHMDLIVQKFIRDLESLTAARNVSLTVSDEAREWLAKTGYSDEYGARPLKRVIKDHVKKPLSRLLVMGSLATGGDAKITLVDQKIVVSG